MKLGRVLVSAVVAAGGGLGLLGTVGMGAAHASNGCTPIGTEQLCIGASALRHGGFIAGATLVDPSGAGTGVLLFCTATPSVVAPGIIVNNKLVASEVIPVPAGLCNDLAL